jgi:hypothetical protein
MTDRGAKPRYLVSRQDIQVPEFLTQLDWDLTSYETYLCISWFCTLTYFLTSLQTLPLITHLHILTPATLTSGKYYIMIPTAVASLLQNAAWTVHASPAMI